MTQKKIIMTLLAFVGILAALYFIILFSLPPVKQEVLVTASDILGEPSEEYKGVMAKYKNGGVMTPEEQRIVQEERIRGLEQFDSQAAAYAREMLEQGYLEVSKSEYLSQKQKEFSQWMTTEMDRYIERKRLNSE